jgi:anti-sigma regulatory factor (Ser/Thr protein kinase)
MSDPELVVPDDGPPRGGSESSPARGQVTQHELHQNFDEAGLISLRSAVAAHASRLGLPDDAVESMVLVAHELATNAVRHAGGAGELRLWRSGDFVTVEVSDHGPGLSDPDLAGQSRPELAAPGGRGLWLVRNFCAKVDIETGSGGTTVTAFLAR